MANSFIDYTSGLSATTFDVPFNVLSITDVVWIVGVDLVQLKRMNLKHTVTRIPCIIVLELVAFHCRELVPWCPTVPQAAQVAQRPVHAT